MSDSGERRDATDAIRSAMRAIDADDSIRDAPPAAVWAGIASALDVTISAPRPADTSSAPRPTRGLRRWIAVAAAAAAVVIATTAVVVTRNGARSSDVVSIAQLSSDGLAGAPAGLTGSAEVVARSGHDVVYVDVDGLKPRTGEFLELWLITPDISGMVSLGTVRADGTYAVPPGLWIDEFPIVDISTEPYDGDPAHSGSSLLRGTLTRA